MSTLFSRIAHGSYKFGFGGVFLISLAVGNFFAGMYYMLKARGGEPGDVAMFFAFVLLGPFVLSIIAGLFYKISQYLNKLNRE